MKNKKITISIGFDLWQWIEQRRGRINRSVYIRDILEGVKTGIDSGSIEV